MLVGGAWCVLVLATGFSFMHTIAEADACHDTIADQTGETIQTHGDVTIDPSDCSMVFANGGYIAVGRPPFSASGDFTIEAFVNVNPEDAYDVIFDSAQYCFGIQNDKGNLYTTEWNYVEPLAWSKANQWSHLAMRYDHAEKVAEMCIDGTCSAEFAVNPNGGANTAAIIGAAAGGLHPLTGKMMYLRQWSARLSDEDISRLATSSTIDNPAIHIDVSAGGQVKFNTFVGGCENGVDFEQDDRTADAQCKECNPGYKMTGELKCEAYVGDCTDGELISQAERTQDNHCGKCDQGYELNDTRCEAYVGDCAHGELISQAERTQDNHCGSCDQGYELSEVTCEKMLVFVDGASSCFQNMLLCIIISGTLHGISDES